MANEKENLQTEEEVETVQTEAADETAETQAGTEESALSALQTQYDELNDRYLRMAAEYDNFRKRSRAERDSVHAEAVAYAVKALLATVDNLSRALAQPTEDAAYKQGIEMTYNQMMESFQSLGVTEIVSEPGTVFDPNLHNAVMHIDDDSFGENVIAEVFQKGFQLGDKVIRHAMVKVAN
ncbi:nucleotide exchange factor GrpE [Butyricicoccus pullicaecorum]|uniref:Protein GrpE n=1 Tax=Butyricicoccus pullicaecorum TaxID=501571 RepID=A0A1Y4LBA5_9FIRM|nr:nucleotide exchange factor GrpE [Butyricicoccus pullicaecorum]OUP54016.1 nucleotide exchange factor GrpE [Butyricicoccus pullicaecorum]